MTTNHSKSAIDRAGRVIAHAQSTDYGEAELFSDLVFDDYRKSHLKPLTELTIGIQNFLQGKNVKYYIAQRLKRKPQIIRKLKRLSVRLSQLQDIGGVRIIVENNSDVDRIFRFIYEEYNKDFSIKKVADYREFGRDDSGYRSLHIILQKNNLCFELQVRSKIQHYWAEAIERTSVIYGHHLKELDGDPIVIDYFKGLSNAFHELECGRKLHHIQRVRLESQRVQAESIIGSDKFYKIDQSSKNIHAIDAILEKEKSTNYEFNNWILIFDWNSISFVSWQIAGRDAVTAANTYSDCERQYPFSEGYEVVLIGSSDVATVRQTHSHYFGIKRFDSIIASLDESIRDIDSGLEYGFSEKKILSVMVRKKFWGQKSVLISTLKNHFCASVSGFDEAFAVIEREGFIIHNSEGVSLNVKEKGRIEAII